MFSGARSDGRIPVFSGPRLVDVADPQQARWLQFAPNVVVVRQRKTGFVVEIHLQNWADDSNRPARWGNPLKLSTDLETPTNIRGVWAFKDISD